MKTRLKLLIYTFIFVILYAIYYWLVPFVINVESRMPQLKNLIKKEMGLELAVKDLHLKMGLTPSIWLNASSIRVVEKDNSSPFYIEKPKVKIRLLPLIIGKIQIAYLSCDKLNADFKLDRNHRLYIGEHLIMSSSNPKISIENSRMNLNGYQIHIKDEKFSKNLLFKGDYLSLFKFNSKKRIKLSTDSSLDIDGKTSRININIDFKLPLKKSFDKNALILSGTITNFDLSNFSGYVKELSSGKIKEISGLLNLETSTHYLTNNADRIESKIILNNLKIIKNDKISSINFPGKLKLFTTFDVSKNKVKIQKLEFLSKNINSSLTGTISKISSNNPVLDLLINVDKSRIEDFITLIPATKELSPDINLVALKTYGYYSDLSGNLSIKGRSNKPILKGKFISTNGYVIKPLPENIPKATVKLDFLGESLFLDVFVPTGLDEHVNVNGTIDLYKQKNVNLEVNTSPNVDLAIIQSVLNPVHEIFNFDLGPVPVMKINGIGNVNLKITGNKLDSHLNGAFRFKNITASFTDINFELQKATGALIFEDKDTHLLTESALLNGKPIMVDGHCDLQGNLDYDIDSKEQNLQNLLENIKNSPKLAEFQKLLTKIETDSGLIDLKLKLKGKVKNIDDFVLGKTVFLEGDTKLQKCNIKLEGVNSPIKNLSGDISFKDNDLGLNLYSLLNGSKINLQGHIKNNVSDVKFSSNSVKINDLLQYLPKNTNFKSNYAQALNHLYLSLDGSYKGALTDFDIDKVILNAKIKSNSSTNSDSSLKNTDIGLKDLPVKIFSGNAEIKNNKLILHKINIIVDTMPILIDGVIENIFKKPSFNLYINSKPNQTFIEKHINNTALYPLKIKGDIIYYSRLFGTTDHFRAKTEMKLEKDSNIYYMGSTLGDLNNPIRIFMDLDVAGKRINLLNFQYDKLISSQNNKEFISQQLMAKGLIYNAKDGIYFHNFNVITQNPTDAKIFNILFKKPMIKKGLFTSNMTINNSINSPYLLGDLSFTGIDIPLLDTTIKDISLKFDRKNIYLKSVGEVFSNKIILSSIVQNKIKAPFIFENLDIYFKNLEINEVIKSLNALEIEADKHKINNQKQDFALTDMIIKDAQVRADEVSVKNINAKDLLAHFSLNENLVFNVDNFKFKTAEGDITGNLKYNLLNSKTNLDLNIDNVNANTMADALFDLPNQLYGSLTGQVSLTCNGKTHKSCMDTLGGQGGFEVSDGRMPKLGSLEYLLKAGNLIKCGVTGLTINGLIDLISPLKTGHFDSIKGDFKIDSGVANSINIFSKGKDLSIFLTGTYNFSTLVADMNIFGRLSKKISTVLGPLGNMSLNSLFNTIPGLNLDEANSGQIIKDINKIPGFELNDKLYRVFTVKIYGDINGDNYVQSFKWVE